MVSQELCCQCSACLMPGKSIAFPAQVTLESSFLHLVELCWFPSTPIFPFHLNLSSSRKSKCYCRLHWAEGQMRPGYVLWRWEPTASRTAKRKGLQDIYYNSKWSCLVLNPFRQRGKMCNQLDLGKYFSSTDGIISPNATLFFLWRLLKAATAFVRPAFLQPFINSSSLAFANKHHFSWAGHSLL